MKKNPNNIASPFFRNNKFKLEEDVLRNTSFKISNNIYGIRKNPDRFLAFHFKQCFLVMNALVMSHFNFIKNKCLIFEKSQYLEIQSFKSSCDMKDL